MSASELNSTPKANRLHLAFFGLRNAGKSTLVNAFCGQEVAIVSPTPGTTTDPVSKAMEILPLGPCLITDTAGLDDEGELGAQRVEKTLKVLSATDVAVWVTGGGEASASEVEWKRRFLQVCQQHSVKVLEFQRGDQVEELKAKIAALKIEPDPALLEGLVKRGGRVVLVCPIDESAPKGRLILPQVQVLREGLDRHALVSVCQPAELAELLKAEKPNLESPLLIITDSQAFGPVQATLSSLNLQPSTYNLTSFSILFARQKGDLEEFNRGLKAICSLHDEDTVLIAEACTHHRQCNDIGTTKIPKAVTKLSGGKKLNFIFASGNDFLEDHNPGSVPALVVHCGGCMITRRTMLARIATCRSLGVPIVNYGLLLQAAMRQSVDADVCPHPTERNHQ